MNSLNREHLLEHLAERLQRGGIDHPDVAAAVLAARGASRNDQTTYARRLGIRVAELRMAEAGAVPVDDLPLPLQRAIGVTESPSSDS